MLLILFPRSFYFIRNFLSSLVYGSQKVYTLFFRVKPAKVMWNNCQWWHFCPCSSRAAYFSIQHNLKRDRQLAVSKGRFSSSWKVMESVYQIHTVLLLCKPVFSPIFIRLWCQEPREWASSFAWKQLFVNGYVRRRLWFHSLAIYFCGRILNKKVTSLWSLASAPSTSAHNFTATHKFLLSDYRCRSN